jgi:hypothetical protein
MIKLTKYFIKAWWNGMKVLRVMKKAKKDVFWSCGEVYFTSRESRDGYVEGQKELAKKWIDLDPPSPLKNKEYMKYQQLAKKINKLRLKINKNDGLVTDWEKISYNDALEDILTLMNNI